MRQDPSETADDFVTKLKSIAAKGKFHDDKEMQDRIPQKTYRKYSSEDMRQLQIS